MADLGFLNFGIGVGGEDLLAKALEKDKKEALEVQKILASIKIEGINFGGAESAVAKSQQAADKAAISSVKLGEAREKAAASSLLGEQRLQTELEKTAAVQVKSAAEIASIQKQAADKAAIAQSRIATESQKLSAIQMAAADKSRVSVASLMALERERAAKQAIYQQKLATEFQRTEAARSRAQFAMVTGERNANDAIGMTNKTMFSQKELLRQLSNAAGIYFSIYQVGAFVKNLALVSGEFEMQRISLENILQDVDAANKLFGQIKTLSVVSPFEFKDLVGYAKQLSAFSIPVNELYDTTKRLADVSAGLGVDMGRIILAYGQVRSASVLRGQELRQFTEAGIPLVEELAKKFGELEGRVVSAGEVFDKISNRLVPFAMVKDVFDDLTSEGGKFFEMQEKQSESLKGKIANLKDAYDIMLYSIGTANDGILKGGVEGITYIMKNWEAFADALMAVVAAYGLYRTAIILNTAITKGLTEAVKLSTVAMKIHDAVLKSTPWGLALSAITALIGGIVFYTSSVRKSNEELMETIGTINKQADSCNELINRLKELTVTTDNDKKSASERASIIAKLNNIEPELAKNIKDHATNLEELTKIQKEYNALMDAMKFGEYAIADGGSFFNDGITEDLDDLNNAQNKLDMSAVKLDATYTKLRENIKRVNEEGEITTTWGTIKLSKKELSDLNNIMSSSVSNAEKTKLALRALFNSETAAGNNLYNSIFGQKDIENISNYASAIRDLTSAEKEAKKEISDFAELMRIRMGNLGIDMLDPVQQNGIRNMIKELIPNKYGQEQILLKLGIEIEDKDGDSIDGVLDGWRKEVKDIVGNSILIQTDSDINDTIKDIKEKAAAVKKQMKEQKLTLSINGFDFETMQFPSSIPSAIPETIKAVGESYKSNAEDAVRYDKALKLLNITLDDKKTGGTGSNKDLIAEKFQKQIDLIKKAQSLYEKYASIMNKEDAVKKVQNDGRFSKDFNPEDYKKYLQEIYAQLGSSPEQKKIKEALSDLFSDIDFGKVKKGVDEIMKKVGAEIDKFKDNYDFYEKLLGAGEDKQSAINIAFGVEFKGNEVDPAKYLSDKIKEAAKEAKFEIDFDINKGNIKDQIGYVYDDLTPELKKQIDALEAWRESRMKESYMNYMKYTENNDTELFGTGALFDMSKVARDAINSYSEIDKKQKDALEGLNAERSKFTNEEYNDRVSKINAIHDLETKNAGKEKQEKLNNLADVLIKQKLDEAGVLEVFNNISTASFKDIKRVQEALDGLDDVALPDEILAQLDKAKLSVEDFKNILDSLSEGKQETVGSKKISKIADIANAAAQSVGELGSSLVELGEATGNSGLSDIGGFLQDFSDFASSAIDITEGIMSKDPSKIIQGVTGLITKLIKGQAEYIKAKKEYELSQLQFQREYRMLILEQQMDFEKGSTMFGGDPYSKAKNSIDVYKKSLHELAEEQKKVDRMDIVTGTKKKKFLFITTGSKDVYGNILSKYPQLIDSQGKFDASVAETILSTQTMSEETKNWLQTMINYSKQAETALEDMHNYMTDVFGELGNTMSDALVDAFKNGTDASDAFYESVSSMLENLAKQMIYSVTLAPLMEKYQKMMEDVMGNEGLSDEQKFKQWADILNNLVGDALTQQGVANDLMNKYQEIAKNKGIDIFKPDSEGKEGLSKGIESITEDTADLLASYLNAMRADMSNQKIYFQKIIDAIIPMSNQFALQVAELKKIEANTYRTANNTEENVKMLGEVKAILKSITTQGSGKKVNI